MKSVAVVCSCLLLCLWANVATATLASVSTLLDNMVRTASEKGNPEYEKQLTLARPCMEEKFAQLEPALVDVLNRRIDVKRECHLSAHVPTYSPEEARAKYKECKQRAPPLSQEDNHRANKMRIECLKDAKSKLEAVSSDSTSP